VPEIISDLSAEGKGLVPNFLAHTKPSAMKIVRCHSCWGLPFEATQQPVIDYYELFSVMLAS